MSTLILIFFAAVGTLVIASLGLIGLMLWVGRGESDVNGEKERDSYGAE